jgi:hypothetical protein
VCPEDAIEDIRNQKIFETEQSPLRFEIITAFVAKTFLFIPHRWIQDFDLFHANPAL